MKNEVNKVYASGDQYVSLATVQPPLYQVMMHNDDFTPMEFVAGILERFFFLEREKAIEVMMEVQTLGKAVCGVFSKDIADSKVSDVMEYSRMHEHPLLCSVENTAS